MNSLLFFSLGLILLFIVIGHVVARRKGLSPVFWGLMGGLFGPLMLPFLLLAKPRKPSSDS